MLQMIVCEHCSKSLSKMIDIELSYKHTFCNSCNNGKTDKEKHFFCSTDCLIKYLDIHKGFLCRSCQGTGDAFGFKSNGICQVCKAGIIDL